MRIDVDVGGRGRVFEGIGAVSAGASSRLLFDYPEPQRSEILDLLFLPRFGAGLQHLKVEIGGDCDSTDGAEPCHMRGPEDEDYSRGYEWWLMREAKARNPAIVLDALAWGAPGWLGSFYTPQTADYICRFVEGARDQHGLEIDFVGIWNEMPYEKEWIKLLKRTLIERGLSTRIVAADQAEWEAMGTRAWQIVDDMLADEELLAAVDVIGVHYPDVRWSEVWEHGAERVEGGRSPSEARELGKPLWDSEDGAQSRGGAGYEQGWTAAAALAEVYNRNYVEGAMTKTLVWSPVTAYYDSLLAPRSGLMQANAPWSGHYSVHPAIWATAHTTQFVQPGWVYLESACGQLEGGGSYVSLVPPAGEEISIVIETIAADRVQPVELDLGPTFAGRVVHVWRSTEEGQFVECDELVAGPDPLRLELQPQALYSLTTTSGQRRGKTDPPAPGPFPLPFVEDFAHTEVGRSPRWFADQEGAFEVVGAAAGARCLEQIITEPAIPWLRLEATSAQVEWLPHTVVGDVGWTDYRVQAEVLLEGPGCVGIVGRQTGPPPGEKGQRGAYWFLVFADGTWELRRVDKTFRGNSIHVLDSGHSPFELGRWHTLALVFAGTTIRVLLDDRAIATATDSTYRRGLAGLASGWNKARFARFSVTVEAEPPAGVAVAGVAPRGDGG